MKGGIVCLCVVLLIGHVLCSPMAKRTSPPHPCVRIADALMEFTEHIVQYQMMYGYGDEELHKLIELFSGVDVRDEERVTEVVCDLIQLGTDADAVANYLVSSGMEESFVKTAYDYVVAPLTAYFPIAQHELDTLDENGPNAEWRRELITEFIHLHNVLNDFGFLDLDPVGVQQFSDWFITKSIDGETRMKRSRASSECQELISILQNHPVQPLTAMRIIGFQSEDEVQHIVCSAAAAKSIDELVEIINTNSIPRQLIAYGFSQLHHLRRGITELEEIVNAPYESIWYEEHRALCAIYLRLLYAMRDAGYF